MHWFLPPLLLLIISQGALSQYPCDLPDAVKIPVSVPWLAPAAGAALGYMWDPDPTLGINKERIPVCLFTRPFLSSVVPLQPYINTEKVVRSILMMTWFRLEQLIGNYSFNISIGKDNGELFDLGYIMPEFLGYSIPCDDMKDKVICIKDPTKTTTTKKTTPRTTTKPCTKKWSEWAWAPGSKCSDTCGNCGKRARQRTCLTCGCTGAAKDTVSCGNPVCYYPRMTCCAGFVKKIDKKTNMFICG